MSAPSSFAIERARMSCTPPAANGTTMRATDWANDAAEKRTSASERRILIDANSTLSASKEASMPKAYNVVCYREIRDQAKWEADRDRKSTRLNSSHQIISYAVFCLKKKNKTADHN